MQTIKIDLPRLDCPYDQYLSFDQDVFLIGQYGLVCDSEFNQVLDYDRDSKTYNNGYTKGLLQKAEVKAFRLKENGLSNVHELSSDYWYIPIVSTLSLVWGHWTDTLQKIHRTEIEFGGEYEGKQFGYIFDRRGWKHPGVKDIDKWLKFLGVDLDRCVFRDDHSPETSFKIPYAASIGPVTYSAHGSKIVFKNIRDILHSKHKPNPSRKVYLSRGEYANRRVKNNKEIYPYLESKGFEIIDTSKLGLEETHKLFSEVDFILSIHHSGIKNCIFSADQIRVIELYPSQFKNGVDRSIMECCKSMTMQYTQEVIESDEHSNINLTTDQLDSLLGF